MNAVGIVAFLVIILGLEAMQDGFQYKAKLRPKLLFSIIYHVAQLLDYLTIFIFGILFGLNYEITLSNILWLILGYTLMRYGIFDLLYMWISGNTEPGKGTIFDRLLTRFPILNNGVIRLLCAFIGMCLIGLKL